MRVIAGSAGGIRLSSGVAELRPTTDRTREAIFSSLAPFIPKARVLDIFAGTGTLGIEALSRGADSAWFVDLATPAIHAIQDNLRRTHFQAEVIKMGALDFLKQHQSLLPFDLIFADPPYRKKSDDEDHVMPLLESPYLRQLLKPNGIFVLEKYCKPLLKEHPAWQIIRNRTYGDSEVVFLQRQMNPSQ